MSKVSIPAELQDSFKALATLEDAKLQDIVTIIETMQVGDSVSKLEAKLIDKELDYFTDLLVSFGNLLNIDQDTQLIINQLISSYQNRFPEAEEDEVKHLENHLINIFISGTKLAQTAKAAKLVLENDNVFDDASTATDVRFLFDNDLNIKYGIIEHRLKIEIITGEHYYFGLQYEDLIKLKYVLDRALLKENKLKELHKDQYEFINFGK